MGCKIKIKTMNKPCPLVLAVLAYLLYKELKREGIISGIGSKEPNWPTTAVAGIGRGWSIDQRPIGTKYLSRVVLTT